MSQLLYNRKYDTERNDNSRKNNNETEIKNKIMCSVLNVVIDHMMEDITPMEEEEWNLKNHNGSAKNKNGCDKKENILVPVIRVFGPLKRVGDHPLQSGCLYIHGAFPYILARPVVAGPDGSLYPIPIMSMHVNWDNRDEVGAIQGEIQATLEETLQSSFLDKGFGEKEDDSMNKNSSDRHQCTIIRKVTVVEGRGFYTFCPGPTTSFFTCRILRPKTAMEGKISYGTRTSITTKVPSRFKTLRSNSCHRRNPRFITV